MRRLDVVTSQLEIFIYIVDFAIAKPAINRRILISSTGPLARFSAEEASKQAMGSEGYHDDG
jgi:hypothetical protein